MNAPEGFRFNVTVEVRFEDVDVMGHVNNAKYFTYMEQGRITYFDEVMGVDRTGDGISVILADAACSYKAPLFYKDVVVVWVRIARLGNKSFQQEYRLVRQSDGLLVAEGRSVTVAYHYKEDQTVPLPEEWQEQVVAFEPAMEG
jgi:acyl-CoA thioester hydrolase